MAPLKLTQPNCCHFCVTSFGYVITKLWSSLEHAACGCPYNDLVICKDSSDCLRKWEQNNLNFIVCEIDWLALHLKFGSVYI